MREMLMDGKLRVVSVTVDNRAAFDRLMQNYEAEFSSITGKMPGPDAVFPLDTFLDDQHCGYLAYRGGIPVGFNLIAVKEAGRDFEVCEFYIIPACRKCKLGYDLAAAVFDLHRGTWEVKQIAGADNAKAFWRKAIGHYTRGNYVEEDYSDSYWGAVTRQRFSNLPHQ